MKNFKVTDFNNIKKLKEVIEMYGNEEQKRVLPKEIVTMDEGTFEEHFNNTVRVMDELTNKKIKEINEGNESMIDYMATHRAITAIIEKQVKESGVETMEDLKDYFSASHHGLFGLCLVDELWYNKK